MGGAGARSEGAGAVEPEEVREEDAGFEDESGFVGWGVWRLVILMF